MKNKKGDFFGGIISFLIIATILLAGFFVYKTIEANNNNCLIETAETFCEENEFVFSHIIYDPRDSLFYCYESERSTEKFKYKFLDEELEECLG